MELSSGPRRRSTQQLGSQGRGADRLSALHDDLLLVVLACMGDAATAARTSVLSRRWRGGLWTHLRQIVFCGIALDSLEAALGLVSPAVSRLEIRVPHSIRMPRPDAARVSSLLLAAARLDPEELVVSLPPNLNKRDLPVRLPRFNRATSIEVHSPFSFLDVAGDARFPALETLSLSGCHVRFKSLLPCCSCLRVLRLELNDSVLVHDTLMAVHSESLQELFVEANKLSAHSVDIVTPQLKQLTISVGSYMEVSISISAPLLEKVSWRWCHLRNIIKFGCWTLQKLRLQTAEGQGKLPSLHIHACHTPFPYADDMPNFVREIEKHMVADFSLLELHLKTVGHVFGGLVVHLLGINRISSTMQTFRISLKRPKVKEECPRDCSCESLHWRSQTISLTALEEVEIDGFGGAYHEYHLLKWIFRCAPMLKRMIVKLPRDALASRNRYTKISKIFQMYSSVECYVYS